MTDFERDVFPGLSRQVTPDGPHEGPCAHDGPCDLLDHIALRDGDRRCCAAHHPEAPRRDTAT